MRPPPPAGVFAFRPNDFTLFNIGIVTASSELLRLQTRAVNFEVGSFRRLDVRRVHVWCCADGKWSSRSWCLPWSH
ncbi:unnamed protein product [Chondrus crispus]|uniref:Uncharacterized protein n=1 Tax=Chondrus crispus TaxID=2769 RepID=R7Q6B5_CHOCR|nr:unnamed protein product [Chondrus crispus]CDF32980.1 unnamed protein product [Chondrus crispus]|eukprot:XP_005712783.1 unnamed protein product [Chondrus crispus]